MLGILILIIPVIAYGRLRRADEIQDALLLRDVREQGHLAAQALAPLLKSGEMAALPQLNHELARFSSDVGSLKLLFEPSKGSGFFYIASWPPVPSYQLETERAALSKAGVLDRLSSSCEGDEPLGLHYRVPERDDEIVTSVTPLPTPSGCWVVVTTLSAGSVPGLNIGQPYWQSEDVRVAAAIYLAMIAVTFTTFWSIRRALRRFVERARAIGERGADVRFADHNDVPDLAEVAAEFDHMVEVLASSAHNLRRSAEDNAHAFKTPIAVIRQSLEPLRRGIIPENQRSIRALGFIENSLDKLDGLVASARSLDEAAALLMDVPRTNLDLSSLIGRLLDAYSNILMQHGIDLKRRLQTNVVVHAHEEMVETVLENLFDNAVSFSPRGTSIEVALAVRGEIAELLISDSGPGVPENHIERIFERYFSYRPSGPDAAEDTSHFGVGLWIAKRNIEALGGTITAQNRSPNGLLVRTTFAAAGRKPLPKAKAADTNEQSLATNSDVGSMSPAGSVFPRLAAYSALRPSRIRTLLAVAAAVPLVFAAGWAALVTHQTTRSNVMLSDGGHSTDHFVAPHVGITAPTVSPLAPPSAVTVPERGLASVQTRPPDNTDGGDANRRLASLPTTSGPDEAQKSVPEMTSIVAQSPAQAAETIVTYPSGPKAAPPAQPTSSTSSNVGGTETEDQQIAAFLALHLPTKDQEGSASSASSVRKPIVGDDNSQQTTRVLDAGTAANDRSQQIAAFLAARSAPASGSAAMVTTSEFTGVASGGEGPQRSVLEGVTTSSGIGEASERYVVQVGSFLDESSALRLADTLTSKGITVSVSRSFNHDGRVWFILRTKEFETIEDADTALRAIGSVANIAPMVMHYHAKR